MLLQSKFFLSSRWIEFLDNIGGGSLINDHDLLPRKGLPNVYIILQIRIQKTSMSAHIERWLLLVGLYKSKNVEHEQHEQRALLASRC